MHIGMSLEVSMSESVSCRISECMIASMSITMSGYECECKLEYLPDRV